LVVEILAVPAGISLPATKEITSRQMTNLEPALRQCRGPDF
jgi:hypothetical protein